MTQRRTQRGYAATKRSVPSEATRPAAQQTGTVRDQRSGNHGWTPMNTDSTESLPRNLRKNARFCGIVTRIDTDSRTRIGVSTNHANRHKSYETRITQMGTDEAGSNLCSSVLIRGLPGPIWSRAKLGICTGGRGRRSGFAQKKTKACLAGVDLIEGRGTARPTESAVSEGTFERSAR